MSPKQSNSKGVIPHSLDRLVLGTVQLGLNYGIANNSGKPDLKEASELIKEAFNNGVHEFDTAQVYGDSEKVLGKIITELGIGNRIRVTSKFNPDIETGDSKIMEKSIIDSLENLKISKLHCIMFHNESVLNHWTDMLAGTFESFISQDMVDNVGISVSSPDAALKALNCKLISIVQIPSNILDRRFEKAGVFDFADKCLKTIYVRSIFLQGLLLMKSQEIPGNMKFTQEIISRLEKYIEEKDIEREAALIGYPREVYHKAKIIFGAETTEQVRLNINTWNTAIDEQIIKEIPSIFSYTDDKLLNPALWPR